MGGSTHTIRICGDGRKGVDFVKANPKKCPANTVIIKEWNGPEESGLVMPARHHGADKLNGLMNVNETVMLLKLRRFWRHGLSTVIGQRFVSVSRKVFFFRRIL